MIIFGQNSMSTTDFKFHWYVGLKVSKLPSFSNSFALLVWLSGQRLTMAEVHVQVIWANRNMASI